MSHDQEKELCGCIKCTEARLALARSNPTPGAASISIWLPDVPGWRYACELCGNKRCPHYTDHRLACTNSNEPGQAGSVFT